MGVLINCSNEWQIEATKKEFDMLEFIYNDGNYGKMWRMIMNLYGHIASKYHAIGDDENAIICFRKMSELAVEFDNLDRISVMQSTMFKGKKFDKHFLGSNFKAKSRVIELLTTKYSLSDEFKNTPEFKEIIKNLS